MFADRLRISLVLTIGSDSFVVPAGAIDRMRIDVRGYGFEAETTFEVSSETEADALFPRFVTRDAIRAALSLASAELASDDDSHEGRLTLTGYAIEKSLEEVASSSIEQTPVVRRKYSLRFLDPARAWWGQHRPVEVHADKSPRELLDLHKAEGIDLELALPRLDQKQAVLCVPLRGDAAPAFYDFVAWLVDRERGVFEYDAKARRYRIASTKARRPGEAAALDEEEVESFEVVPRNPTRATTVAIAPLADGPRRQPIPNLHAVESVRRHVMHHVPLQKEFDRLAALDGLRSVAPGPLVEVIWRKFPRSVRSPGYLVTVDEGFSENILPHGRTFRVHSVSLVGAAREGPDDRDLEAPDAPFDLDMRTRLELQGDATPYLPAFREPPYPIYVEGRVLSASGGEKDRTWYTSGGEDGSPWRMRVHVPLFAQDLVVPFVPGRMPGHFFFPPYKAQRVLLALRFDGAAIERFLDWAPDARVPSDSQGDRIALGQREENGTLVGHSYVDAKPLLRIQRRAGADLQTLELSDGTIRLETKELPQTASQEPKFDVTPRVEAAKDQLKGAVEGSIEDVSGQFSSASESLQTAVGDTVQDVSASVASAETKLTADIARAEGELDELASSLSAALQTIVAKVAEAKAALVAALEG